MKPILRRPAETAGEREVSLRRYREIRQWTETLAAPLSPEDQTVQSMPDVSPTKWHRAHTSWFFETFLLQRYVRDYRLFDPVYGYLFNSYYEAVGPRHPRPERGLLSRPAVGEIARYRAHVDDAMTRLIVNADSASWPAVAERIELGLQHEQQHQELILMDIKHVLSLNPLDPTYKPLPALRAPADAPPLGWHAFEGGLRQIGHDGTDFAFDNEQPRHKIWLEPFRLATRLITCGEYLAFIEDGGYSRANLWLSNGWAVVQQQNWQAPLYWRQDEDCWSIFTLAGRRALDPAEPVSHVSFYEADAFARWCGKRLPNEAEWEIAAVELAVPFADNRAGVFHPTPASGRDGLQQMIGDVWQWTQSPYVGYPGYRAPEGAIGEYNGKFMVDQMVLRGGAAVTPSGHARLTYRNFFPAGARWAMSGIRLAEDAS